MTIGIYNNFHYPKVGGFAPYLGGGGGGGGGGGRREALAFCRLWILLYNNYNINIILLFDIIIR